MTAGKRHNVRAGHRLDTRALYERLDSSRQDEGLTWEELGSRLGVSRRVFSHMREGRGGMHSTPLVSILAHLDAVDDLWRYLIPNDEEEGQ